MDLKEIEIIIDKDGRVQVRVQGVHGEGCLALTKNIEEAIGTVEERACTGEYYGQPVEMNGCQKNSL